jgi:hypothetical protein
MKFSILTPTTGNPLLEKLLVSINRLDTNHDISIEHLIVVDGPKFKESTDSILERIPAENHERYVFYLPFNTGADGYLGHKIYASISQLVHGDYVLFIDNDNWLEPNHIISLYNAITKKKLDWVYSLRKIMSDNGDFICNDDCESLGYLSNAFYNRNVFFIDTNCTCVKREIVIALSPIWNRKGFNADGDPDRLYSRTLMSQFPNYSCTCDYTINYTVANRNGSVKGDLFLKGNEVIRKIYGEIPWQKPQIFIAHFNQENTEKVIKRIYEKDRDCIAYKQWQLNILDCMNDNLCISAYNPFIPANSRVLFHMCNPGELPTNVIQRKDVEKVLYTIESPNIRHQAQWDLAFMLKNFTKIITYWKPLIAVSKEFNNCISYFPFIHRFNFNSINDMSSIIENKNVGKQVCIVLEKRDIRGDYTINGVSLKAQDYLRWEYASKLGKRIDCYGKTWEQHKELINYRQAKNRFLDEESVIDIMSKYTFALIIENCNADGYVSEKIYDALTVGCIPLYYGNNNKDLGIPDDCYIDLKYIGPQELPLLLDSMDAEFIEAFRKNIYKKRMAILDRVSVNSYNRMLKSD